MVAREGENPPRETDKPAHQRPELPDFWDHRFRQGVTPWDAGRVPHQFAEFSRRHRQSFAISRGNSLSDPLSDPQSTRLSERLSERRSDPLTDPITDPLASGHAARPRALVPGCGSAYEAGHLDALDWSTDAIDFSPAAIEAARATLPDFGGALHCADFFHFGDEASYDLVYERAFLCALPRPLWPDYAPRMARLLRPGGLLAGYFFIDEAALKGPPFGIAVALLENFCTPWFELIEDVPSVDAIGPFAGRERWMVWRRR